MDLQATLYIRPAFEITVDVVFLSQQDIETRQLGTTPRSLSVAEFRDMQGRDQSSLGHHGSGSQCQFVAANLIPFSSDAARRVDYVKDYDVTVVTSWIAAEPVFDSVLDRIVIAGQVCLLPEGKIGIDLTITRSGVVLPIETVTTTIGAGPEVSIGKPVEVSCRVDALGQVSEGEAIALVGPETKGRKPVFVIWARRM